MIVSRETGEGAKTRKKTGHIATEEKKGDSLATLEKKWGKKKGADVHCGGSVEWGKEESETVRAQEGRGEFLKNYGNGNTNRGQNFKKKGNITIAHENALFWGAPRGARRQPFSLRASHKKKAETGRV